MSFGILILGAGLVALCLGIAASERLGSRKGALVLGGMILIGIGMAATGDSDACATSFAPQGSYADC